MGTVCTKKEDGTGRVYHTVYANIETSAVVSAEGKNTVFKGNPKINLRKGTSEFGEEVFMEFLINKKISEYPSNTTYQTIEIYFGAEEGIKFLEDALKYLKENQSKGD